VAAFGYWPSFHDAEIVGFELRRNDPLGQGESALSLHVRVREYEARDAGTANYHLAETRACVIHFQFRDARNISIIHINDQNVIDDIVIESCSDDSGEWLDVEVESIYGFGGSWRCTRAEVALVYGQGQREA
jgi:hypothetical protein